MTKQQNAQTNLIHAPRNAPQYIETVQPPYIVHLPLFLKAHRTFLIVIGQIPMTIATAHMAHQQHLRLAITSRILKAVCLAYWHRVVYLRSI